MSSSRRHRWSKSSTHRRRHQSGKIQPFHVSSKNRVDRSSWWLERAERKRPKFTCQSGVQMWCTLFCITSFRPRSSWPGPFWHFRRRRWHFGRGSWASAATKFDTCKCTAITSSLWVSRLERSPSTTGSGNVCPLAIQHPHISSRAWASRSRARTSITERGTPNHLRWLEMRVPPNFRRG